MVVSGRITRVAFYCRMNHRDRDCSQFYEEIQDALNQKYGEGNWEMKTFYEIASGANPNRGEFSRLKMEIVTGYWDAVVTMKADTIARDWKQFLEFMRTCDSKGVEVICTRGPGIAYPIYERIEKFIGDYFEGSDCS